MTPTARSTASANAYRTALDSCRREVEALTAGLRQAQEDLAKNDSDTRYVQSLEIMKVLSEFGITCVKNHDTEMADALRKALTHHIEKLKKKLAAALDPTTGADHREPGDEPLLNLSDANNKWNKQALAAKNKPMGAATVCITCGEVGHVSCTESRKPAPPPEPVGDVRELVQQLHKRWIIGSGAAHPLWLGEAAALIDAHIQRVRNEIYWDAVERHEPKFRAQLEQEYKNKLADRDALAAEVREWLCDKCNTVYPGPPQKGFACIMCPKCGGRTGPRMRMEKNALAAELAQARDDRDESDEQLADTKKKLAAALDPTAGADHREPGDK